MASTSSAYESGGEIPSTLDPEVENTTTEDNFQQTIELLQIEAEELRFSLVSIYQTDVTQFFRFSNMIFPLDFPLFGQG